MEIQYYCILVHLYWGVLKVEGVGTTNGSWRQCNAIAMTMMMKMRTVKYPGEIFFFYFKIQSWGAQESSELVTTSKIHSIEWWRVLQHRNKCQWGLAEGEYGFICQLGLVHECFC